MQDLIEDAKQFYIKLKENILAQSKEKTEDLEIKHDNKITSYQNCYQIQDGKVTYKEGISYETLSQKETCLPEHYAKCLQIFKENGVVIYDFIEDFSRFL